MNIEPIWIEEALFEKMRNSLDMAYEKDTTKKLAVSFLTFIEEVEILTRPLR